MDQESVPAVETTKLSKQFGDVVAVDALDLRVEAGRFFGFLGPNGAGKSTTIKMLTGMIQPGSGTACILGHDVADDPIAAKQLTGVVSEEGAVFERLTGAEYLEFVGRMFGMDRPVIRERADELLELMGLEDDRAKLIVDYSHGMQKKICFAAALIHDPKVLFLDEPFEGIDAVTSRLIKTILGQLRAAGVTIFLTSHILEIVEKLCAEIAIIDHGRIVARGTLDELRKRSGGNDTLEALTVWGLLRELPHPSTIAMGFAVLASTTVLLSIFGNITSIALPVSRSIATVTSAASPIGTLIMIGCLFAGLGIAGLALLGAALGGAHYLRIVFAVVVFGIVAAVYRGSLPKAESLLADRREELMHMLGS